MTTTIFPASGVPPTLPGLKIEESMTKSDLQPAITGSQLDRNGSQPVPSAANDSHRLLSQDEWVQFCRGVGVLTDEESETVIRPTCWYWPAKGFPDGLYQDVLWEKAKFSYWFHTLSMIRRVNCPPDTNGPVLTLTPLLQVDSHDLATCHECSTYCTGFLINA
jgi:hypothetical protein